VLTNASATTSTAVPPTTPTRAPPTVVASTTSTTTTTTTVAPTTTTLPGVAGLATDPLQVLEIGRSVDGRPITAVERGTPGGTVVLVIGVIHGDEAAGVKIVERLATAALPPGIDLWLIESMNPDGQAAGTRTNAHLVDLNRNFPYAWAPLGEPGDSQYGGSGPASEPETQAIVEFITAIQPDIGIWYHQDLFRIAPGQAGRDAEVRARYAELTGLPVSSITGGTYTGVAATWQRTTIPDGVAFIVELGPRLRAAEAAVHASAVLEVATL
jgi:murein peptide amidase A